MPFIPPRKVILTKQQLEVFQASRTHEDIVSCIETLNEAVVGVKLTDECAESPVRECHHLFSSKAHECLCA